MSADDDNIPPRVPAQIVHMRFRDIGTLPPYPFQLHDDDDEPALRPCEPSGEFRGPIFRQ